MTYLASTLVPNVVSPLRQTRAAIEHKAVNNRSLSHGLSFHPFVLLSLRRVFTWLALSLSWVGYQSVAPAFLSAVALFGYADLPTAVVSEELSPLPSSFLHWPVLIQPLCAHNKEILTTAIFTLELSPRFMHDQLAPQTTQLDHLEPCSMPTHTVQHLSLCVFTWQYCFFCC